MEIQATRKTEKANVTYRRARRNLGKSRRSSGYRAASVAQVAAGICFDTTAEGGAPIATSIAVLPFANLSGDPQLGYFAPGVTNVFAGPTSLKPGPWQSGLKATSLDRRDVPR